MKKTLIYVYDDINSFLDQMEYLNKEYNEIEYYYKYVVDIKEMKHQLKFIKGKNILCSYGYFTKKIIKLTIRDRGKKYCIEYLFKSKYIYKKFNREIRKLQIWP